MKVFYWLARNAVPVPSGVLNPLPKTGIGSPVPSATTPPVASATDPPSAVRHDPPSAVRHDPLVRTAMKLPVPTARETLVATGGRITPVPPDKPVRQYPGVVGGADLSDGEHRSSLADVIESIQARVVHRSSQVGAADTGFIVGTYGLVVTNEHVVVNMRTVRIWSDLHGRSYEGHVLERDSTSDLAFVYD